MNNNNFTFITGWFSNHGITYLDMVIMALDKGLLSSSEPGKKHSLISNFDQYKAAKHMFSGDWKPNKISTVYYFLPPKEHTRNRIIELIGDDKWKTVEESLQREDPNDQGRMDLFRKLRAELQRKKKFPEEQWFSDNWGKWGGRETCHLWHIVNEAPLCFQQKWYKSHSQIFKSGIVEFVDVLINEDGSQPLELTRKIRKWLKEKDKIDSPLINLWGTDTEIQFAWYYLGWWEIKFKNAIFIHCKTENKNQDPSRFRPLTITVTEKDLIGELTKDVTPQKWESASREKTKSLLEKYVNEYQDRFIILLLGERGSGKSATVRELFGKNLTEVNCAVFADPTQARSELFGHEKDAFTGATKKREGLFMKAKEKILFLDEIHHLDEKTRHMLLISLQTDNDGNYTFFPLGADNPKKTKFQLIVGSNLSFAELQKKLEPDFFDRISQRQLEMPNIQPEELEGAWKQVWKQMKFIPKTPDPMETDEHFCEWLKKQSFPGNFRDLQRIAITIADYRRSGEHGDLIKHLEHEETLRQCSVPIASGDGFNSLIDLWWKHSSQTEKDFLDLCRQKFAKKLKTMFQSQTKAVTELRKRGSKITKATFNKWINLPDKPELNNNSDNL